MTNDLEEQLTAALRGRAEAPVDADALLAGALAAGRARVRRHRLATAGGAGVAGLTAAALIAVPLALAPEGDGDGTPPQVGFVGDLPVLPAAQGQPGAEQRPDLVGADPTVLRFGLDEAPLPVSGIEWGSFDGTEHMRVSMVDDDGWGISAIVQLTKGTLPPPEWDDATTANTSREVRVDGRPAVLEDDGVAPGNLPRRWLTWQPADGLRMRVSVLVESVYLPVVPTADGGRINIPGPTWTGHSIIDDPAFVVDLAESVRLDDTTRCGAPMRLTDVPGDARLTGCAAGGGASNDSTIEPGWVKLSLRGPGGALNLEASTWSFPDPIPSASYVSPDPSSEPPVSYSPTGGGSTGTPGPGAGPSAPATGIAQFDDAGVNGEVTATGSYGQRDAERVAAGVRQAGDPREPATWPVTPVG